LIIENDSFKTAFLVQQRKRVFIRSFEMHYVLLTSKKSSKNIIPRLGRTPSNFKFNGVLLYYNYSLTLFLTKQHFGISHYFVKQLEGRLEMSKLFSFNSYIVSKWPIFYKLITGVIPNTCTMRGKLILNLNLLFLIRSYRGWRHTFSLPSRGQRT